MNKIIYFVLLCLLPLVVMSVAHAQTRRARVEARQGMICGHVFKTETRSFKSTPVIYIVTNKGRAYTIYPEYGPTPKGKLGARLAVMDRLEYLDLACLVGTAFNEIFVPDAFVERNTRVAGRNGNGRNGEQQAAAAQPRPQQRRNMDWVPWNKRGEAAP